MDVEDGGIQSSDEGATNSFSSVVKMSRVDDKNAQSRNRVDGKDFSLFGEVSDTGQIEGKRTDSGLEIRCQFGTDRADTQLSRCYRHILRIRRYNSRVACFCWLFWNL